MDFMDFEMQFDPADGVAERDVTLADDAMAILAGFKLTAMRIVLLGTPPLVTAKISTHPLVAAGDQIRFEAAMTMLMQQHRLRGIDVNLGDIEIDDLDVRDVQLVKGGQI